jgi:hypothetical protein
MPAESVPQNQLPTEKLAAVSIWRWAHDVLRCAASTQSFEKWFT